MIVEVLLKTKKKKQLKNFGDFCPIRLLSRLSWNSHAYLVATCVTPRIVYQQIESHKVASCVFHLIEFAIVAELRSFDALFQRSPCSVQIVCERNSLDLRNQLQRQRHSQQIYMNVIESHRERKSRSHWLNHRHSWPWNKTILAVSKIIDDKVRWRMY